MQPPTGLRERVGGHPSAVCPLRTYRSGGGHSRERWICQQHA